MKVAVSLWKKNTSEFISQTSKTTKNVTILDLVNAVCDHRMVRAYGSTKEGRNILIRKPLTKLMNLQRRNSKFTVTMYNRYKAQQEENGDTHENNKNNHFQRKCN